ncbi:hypothetical protein BpHYR1_043166 [Brachionus plicatilis]|uniref:Uncharacterized protein n=1 Tax=Brachionus plicatilis TaxID=10195 RepID=A0A3M7QIM3_BRAPC|nr:hypothetical protein BpHYR1_043166 [Brachionus plicatilis]
MNYFSFFGNINVRNYLPSAVYISLSYFVLNKDSAISVIESVKNLLFDFHDNLGPRPTEVNFYTDFYNDELLFCFCSAYSILIYSGDLTRGFNKIKVSNSRKKITIFYIESQCSLAELDGRLRHRIFEILSMQQTNFPHVQKDFTEQFRIKIRENFPQNPNETIDFYRSADNRKFLEIKEHLARYVPHDRTFEKAFEIASNSLKTSRSVVNTSAKKQPEN